MKVVILEHNYRTVREITSHVTVQQSNGVDIHGKGISMKGIKRPFHVFPDDMEVQVGDHLSAEQKERCMRGEIDDPSEDNLKERLKKLEAMLEER